MSKDFAEPEVGKFVRASYFWPSRTSKIGDSVTGCYLGCRDTDYKGKPRVELGLWIDGDSEATSINVNPSLGDALEALRPPKHVRLKVSWSANKDVNQGLPMRVFALEIVGPPSPPKKAEQNDFP